MRPLLRLTCILLGTVVALAPGVGLAATPCQESDLAPFYPLGSPELETERARITVSTPTPEGPWYIYLDGLSREERLALAEASLKLQPTQLARDAPFYTDVGIIEAAVTGIQQSSTGLSTYMLEVNVISVWARKGMVEFVPGQAAAVIMEGDFKSCPDRAVVYHPYPCVGDTLLAGIIAGPVFDGCAATFSGRWALLDRLPERERRALRELAQELVLRPEEPMRTRGTGSGKQ